LITREEAFLILEKWKSGANLLRITATFNSCRLDEDLRFVGMSNDSAVFSAAGVRNDFRFQIDDKTHFDYGEPQTDAERAVVDGRKYIASLFTIRPDLTVIISEFHLG